MRKIFCLLVVVLLPVFHIYAQDATEGALYAVNKKGAELGACPLKNTSVKADISGFLARVTVVQEFENNFAEPIEAIYLFPLSQNAAVDAMTMRVGERTIRGLIKRREEARQIYEQAKTDGKTASLLDQERPNIFTQSVANILPGEKILIEISYVETLKYEEGQYEFVFPMTVAPRYNPASTTDGQKISPNISPTRTGQTISIEVNLNAGVPVEEIRSGSHEIETVNLSANSANIKLKDAETIPNKDFVLRYDVTGKRIEDAILAHRSGKGGFLTMILQPPDKFGVEDVTPKEIVFVLDSSGSMSGFPIEKAKEAINLSLEGLYPNDTFNLITFAGDTSVLFDAPVPATQANIERAREFLEKEGAGGGTEMMKAIKAALAPTDSQEHIRIVCFMTDGLVSNEAEIIAEVQKHPKARVFSFGIGESVNRYLLDKIAEAGRGEAEYVSLTDDGSKAARKFYERVRTPMLTDISIDWNGLPVTDVYPKRIGDLFSAKPVVLNGRYAKAASGTIRLKGKVGGQEYVREIAVNLPETANENDVLASLWARTKIDELMNKSLRYDTDTDEQYLDMKARTKNEIIALGLKYNLLTAFTSFVAVEDKVKVYGGKPRKIIVPVETPEGMKQSPLLSKVESDDPYGFILQTTAGRRNSRNGSGSGNGYGSGNGSGGGGNMPRSFANVNNLTLTLSGNTPKIISTGVVNGKAIELIKPPYPPAGRVVRASGAVTVQVVIDEQGSVVSASAVSGHPLLRAAASAAAMKSKFTPTILSGQPVRVTGVIVYNFTGEENAASPTFGEIKPAEPLTPEQQAERERLERQLREEETRAEQAAKRQQMLAEKLHFWVFAIVERLEKNQSNPASNESKFVSGNSAEIEIRLTARTPEAIEKLKAAGFVIAAEDKTKIVGKTPLENLMRLAEIAEVRYIFPNLR